MNSTSTQLRQIQTHNDGVISGDTYILCVLIVFSVLVYIGFRIFKISHHPTWGAVIGYILYIFLSGVLAYNIIEIVPDSFISTRLLRI